MTDLAEPRPRGAKTNQRGQTLDPPPGWLARRGRPRRHRTPEATPARLETSSPLATPKSAPALTCKHGLQATRVPCGQRAFDHTTGQGYVKSQRGHCHGWDLLHETFGVSAATSRRLQLQSSTVSHARLSARALTAPPTPSPLPPLVCVTPCGTRISIACFGEGGEPRHPRCIAVQSSLPSSHATRRAFRGLENPPTPSPFPPSKLKAYVQRTHG